MLRMCLRCRYGYVPQWAPSASMALFVPAYMPMQYAGQQLPDTSNGQGSQVGSLHTCCVSLHLVQILSWMAGQAYQLQSFV